MDLAGWARRLSDLPSQRAVEHPLRLAVPPVDARDQGRRTRRGAGAAPVFLPANAAGESSDSAALAGGIVRVTLLRASAAVSFSWLVLSGLLRSILRPAREKLLPGPDL